MASPSLVVPTTTSAGGDLVVGDLVGGDCARPSCDPVCRVSLLLASRVNTDSCTEPMKSSSDPILTCRVIPLPYLNKHVQILK